MVLSATLLASLSALSILCNALPLEYEVTLPYNFTLNAVNKTLLFQNNPPAAPLVLGQNGASTGITFHVTSTYVSYPYDDYPKLFIRNGSMGAYDIYGRWITNATEVQSGGPLSWVTTTLYASRAPEVYSALRVPGKEHPLLAIRGVANMWSLCPYAGTRPQTNIVFNVSSLLNPPPLNPNYGFDPTLCYPVELSLVKID